MNELDEFKAKPPCRFVQMVKLPSGKLLLLWVSSIAAPPLTETWDYRHEYGLLMCKVRSHPSWQGKRT